MKTLLRARSDLEDRNTLRAKTFVKVRKTRAMVAISEGAIFA